MKYIMISFLCLGISPTVMSSNDSLPHMNFYLGIGGGRNIKGKIFGLNLTFLKQGGYGIQLKNQTNYTVSKQLPLDYTCSIFAGATKCGTEDLLSATSFKLVRQFLTQSKRVRFGLEVGPSLISNKIAHFKPGSYHFTANGTAYHGSFYNTSYTEKNAVGLDVSAKIQLPLLTFFGAEFGITSNLNKLRSFVGYELIFNIGLVRNVWKKNN